MQPLCAQDTSAGEVINVNYKYKIVFTDLTDDELSIGDTVEIKDLDEHVAYLEVLETSSIMSKLGPRKEDVLNDTLPDFQDITVGFIVQKVPSRYGRRSELFSDVRPPERPAARPSANVSLLESENRNLREEIGLLREEKRALESRLYEVQQQIQDEEGADRRSNERLRELREENSRFERENRQLRSKLRQLERKLKTMSNLIEENLSNYE